MGKGKDEAIREAIKEKLREYTCDLGVEKDSLKRMQEHKP